MGAGALAALIGVGAVNMVHRSGLLLAEAGRWAKLDPAEARRRTFGAAYTDAIDAIRRALPDDSWYLVVSPESSDASGWALWVRYGLAPRRPVLIQPRAGRGLRAANGGGVPKWVRWAVLPDDHGVPVLLTREEALARLRDHSVR
ncbi:MAG: hypothetical protein ABIS20_15185 [Thermoanaerobaculia bacterium]